LQREVDRYLTAVDVAPTGEIVALIAPHAGLMYSGPVAAYAHKAIQGRSFDVVVLVGPSHFVGFDGVAAYDAGAFASPLGQSPIAADETREIERTANSVHVFPKAHVREHSLEMQLPFLHRLLPELPIVPLLMGYQTRETIADLGRALASVLQGRRALIVASTDLSHYFDRRTAAALDGRVVDFVDAFDPEGLLQEFEKYPEHERGRFVACGGGPAISVLLAARTLGARNARVLRYADSGDVSGDEGAVVGYMAAVIGDVRSSPAHGPRRGREQDLP
jgi:AmmeMemoRadiSam system protein B